MDETQKELPLPFPELSGDMPLLPARMVNEYQYCPPLAYLEAAASFKHADVRNSDTDESGYPRRFAAASLTSCRSTYA